jgi:bacterioferritin
VRDFPTRDLFSKILASEEEHIDHLEQQFEMIDRMGIHNYIQLQSVAAGE